MILDPAIFTVSDHKDTKFWNQFTTGRFKMYEMSRLFQTTKIQNFETNSQRNWWGDKLYTNCFRPQRYKILKPIHNFILTLFVISLLFQTTKIQNFETNSQQLMEYVKEGRTVSDHKDTKFWNQFTTTVHAIIYMLYCFRPQRYKILKPIHNITIVFTRIQLLFQTTKIQNFETNSQRLPTGTKTGYTVSDHKDTKFWNQFTTPSMPQFTVYYCFRPQRYKILKPIHNGNTDAATQAALFQTTKIQNFETNSQQLHCLKAIP